MNVILGAGLAGLSVSWHLRHRDCLILERSDVIGGHARSVVHNGFTLDHGPHVSFTRDDYVRNLFATNTDGDFHEFPISVANFYCGHLVAHPAQVHLWQLPEPLRTSCATDMRQAASRRDAGLSEAPPANYAEWLRQSFGATFADTLPAAYTRKYWTVDPTELSTDWLGPRMHTPSPAEIEAALVPGSLNQGYYITSGRYPCAGGYQRFFERFAEAANIRFGADVASINLLTKTISLKCGETLSYDRLISTLPLPAFVRMAVGAPDAVIDAANALDCTEVLLVDVFAPKIMQSDYKWFYVYDENLLSTRIHCVEGLAQANAPAGMTGIQVEVYSSRHRPATAAPETVAARVAQELIGLGFVSAADLTAGRVDIRWRSCPYANVMFTHKRREALNTLWTWLEAYGLERAPDDLAASTDWQSCGPAAVGEIVMAGRFAQWKYFWTDDCVLRGKQVARAVASNWRESTRP